MATPSDAEAELWALIAERAASGGDVAAIDRRVWDRFGATRAIMFTDLSGFGRQVAAFGILHFLQVIFEQKRLLLPILEAHRGQLLKVEADSLLVLFETAREAVDCAIAMQHACQEDSRRRPPESRVLLCVGIGFGDVLRIGDVDVYGQEVNAASKLGEDIARADEIVLTAAARDAVGAIDGCRFESLDVTVPGSPGSFRLDYLQGRAPR